MVASPLVPAGQEEVVLDIPRSDSQIPAPDPSPECLPAFRADLQIILQTDRLRIQFKEIVGMALENLQQMVDQVDQPESEGLERLVPFPVPVRMGDHVRVERTVRFHRVTGLSGTERP